MIYNEVLKALKTGEGKIQIADSDGNVIGDVKLSDILTELQKKLNKADLYIDANKRLGVRVEADNAGLAKDDSLTPLSNLDIALSALRDALKPVRSTPTQDLSSTTIPSGSFSNINKTSLNGYSAIVVTVSATYNSSATSGVRVRWLYSPDGTNYDSPADAEAQGNYEDLSFVAGSTRQRTVLIPIFADNVRIQIVNLDPTYSVTVNMWSWLIR